jgi:hypothetical protein
MPTATATQHRRVPPEDVRSNPFLPTKAPSLTKADLIDITVMGADLPPHLKAVTELRSANSTLRQEFAKLVWPPRGTLFSRCVSAISSIFTAKRPAPELLKRSLQAKIGENVTELKQLLEGKIQPTIEQIRQAHHGKTFVRTKDTPQSLILAAIPTEKIKKKLPTHVELMIGVENFISSEKGCRARVVENKLGERMVITRLNKNNEEETLEISYRRQGKVDITLTTKNGVTEKSLWNDDANHLATSFAAGKSIRFESKRYDEYTVAAPTAS